MFRVFLERPPALQTFYDKLQKSQNFVSMCADAVPCLLQINTVSVAKQLIYCNGSRNWISVNNEVDTGFERIIFI